MATITRDTTISYRGQVIRLAKGQEVGSELGRFLADTDGPVKLTDGETKQAKRIARQRKEAAKAAAEAAAKAAEEEAPSGGDVEGGTEGSGDPGTGGDDQGGGEDEAPPGNASREDWATYADRLGIEVDGLGRDEIKAAVDAHGQGS